MQLRGSEVFRKAYSRVLQSGLRFRRGDAIPGFFARYMQFRSIKLPDAIALLALHAGLYRADPPN